MQWASLIWKVEIKITTARTMDTLNGFNINVYFQFIWHMSKELFKPKIKTKIKHEHYWEPLSMLAWLQGRWIRKRRKRRKTRRWSDASIKWLPSINQITRVINIVSCDIITHQRIEWAAISAMLAAARSETAMKPTQRADWQKNQNVKQQRMQGESKAYRMHSFSLVVYMTTIIYEVSELTHNRGKCVLRRKWAQTEIG